MLLLAARELLHDPERWTKYAPARNERNEHVKPTDPQACRWCLMGAIAHFAPGGIIPYNVLRYVDEMLPPFMPNFKLVDDHGFEWTHDHMFDHPKMLAFLDFLILG